MSVWWSIGLASVGLLGLWLAGSGRSVGWAVGIVAQVLWIAYAVTTRQWGFIATALAYGVVYARNFQVWQRKREVSGGE